MDLILIYVLGFEAPHDLSIFLAGFDIARLIIYRARSSRKEDTNKIRNVYQHPERHGTNIQYYGIRHDMYSLGIILMLIGAWRPLNRVSDTAEELSKRNHWTSDSEWRQHQQALIEFAKGTLAGMTGTVYADTVVCCLEDSVSGVEKTEREMREVFYEKVLRPLKRIVI